MSGVPPETRRPISRVNTAGEMVLRPKWNRQRWSDIPGTMSPEAAQIIETVALHDDGSGVLAFGIGSGKLLALAATLFSGPVVGVDAARDASSPNPLEDEREAATSDIQSIVCSLSGRDSVELIYRDTARLTPGDLGRFTESGFSFISVDARRDPDVGLSDLTLAAELLKPRGVLMIDDDYTAIVPEPQEALWRFLFVEKRLKAFAKGYRKTLLTDAAGYSLWHQRMKAGLHVGTGLASGLSCDKRETSPRGPRALGSAVGDEATLREGSLVQPAATAQLRRSRTAMAGMEFVRLDTRYGEMFVPDADTVIGRALKLYGEWAEDEISFLSGLIANGDAIVDVGANIGTHALAFAKRFPDSSVVAIEPQAAPFAGICATGMANSLGNLHAFNIAVGDTEGVKHIHIDYSSVGWNVGAVNINQEISVGGSQRPVLLTTLDRLLPQEDVRLLKIDVEGMEAEVIRGGQELISRCRPYIYFEVLDMAALVASKTQLDALEYELRWLETAAFNPRNYRGDQQNIWWLGEVGVLAMPSAHDPRVAHLPFVTGNEAEPPRQAFALHSSSDP